jgi:hypothetical protein
LATVFMDVALNLTFYSGLYSMINQASWMLKPSYEEFRKHLIKASEKELSISSLLYLGPNVFEGLDGEVVQSVCFSVKKSPQKFSVFYKLNRYKTSVLKEEAFIINKNNFYQKALYEFNKFSGKQFGFWIKEELLESFKYSPIRLYGDARQGIKTGANEYFIKTWHEISKKKFLIKWYPVDKGGEFKKWYGNNNFVLNWEKNGFEIKNFKNGKGKLRSRPQNLAFFFKDGITWSTSAGKKPSFRYSSSKFAFESSGSKFFVLSDSYSLEDFIAFFNTKITEYIIEVFAPGIGFSEGSIKSLPFLKITGALSNIRTKSKRSMEISKYDWDAREVSWDFQKHPFLAHISNNLQNSFKVWLLKVSSDFFQLHHNEEELNRIFIEIYGLQDELTSDVPLKEITILQDELDYNTLEQLQPPFEGQLVPVKREVVMQQLISYSIGCFMGRYRLDAPGLHIAHPNPTKDEITGYTYNGHRFEIDDDAIIPVMGTACDFPDDAVNRFKNFLDIVWGDNTRIENINFLQEFLDQDVEKFMIKDFWKVHCKMYNKKPIYWLFSSPKGAFQVLVYVHRMNAFTVEKIRSKYLIDHLKSLRSKISLMEKSESSLNAQDSRVLDKLRKDLQECEQYDMALKPFADKQITFDLDDGVTENYKLFKGVVAEIK